MGWGWGWHPTGGGWKISSGVGEAMVSAKGWGPATRRLVHDCGKRPENGVFQNTSTAEWSKLWGASRQCSALLCSAPLSRSSHRSASHRISTPTHTEPPVWRWCTYCSLLHCTAHTALQTLHTRTAQTKTELGRRPLRTGGDKSFSGLVPSRCPPTSLLHTIQPVTVLPHPLAPYRPELPLSTPTHRALRQSRIGQGCVQGCPPSVAGAKGRSRGPR